MSAKKVEKVRFSRFFFPKFAKKTCFLHYSGKIKKQSLHPNPFSLIFTYKREGNTSWTSFKNDKISSHFPATLFITKNNLHKTRRKYYRLTGKSHTTSPNPLSLLKRPNKNERWNATKRKKY